MKKLLFGLFALSLLATSCKKDKDAPAVTKENLAGTYKLMTVKVTINGSPELDADDREDCEKDDLIKINADNTFNYTDAGSVCDPAGDFNATYALSGNDISSEDYEGLNGTVTSFDGTNLEITLNGTEGDMTYKIRTTFKKQ